jgi:four helix bundle protein
MAGVRRYEDLVVWRLSYELQREVFAITETGPVTRDFSFRNQIRDASASGPRNIAEGFGRFNPADFARYLEIAKGSLTETHQHLRDGRDRGYFSEPDCARLSKLTGRAAKAAISLIRYLRQEAKRQALTRSRR